MLDPVTNILLEKLVEGLLNEGQHVLQFHDEFKALKTELLFMQSYLKDAEKVRVKDQKETLKVVVQELRELLYSAEDLVLDCEFFLESERRKMATKCMTYCSPSFLRFRYLRGKKLGEINKGIRALKEKMRSYLPTTSLVLNQEHLGINRPVRYPVLMNDAEFVGLDDAAKEIIKWVLELQGSLNVIGIVGMGGIGKTTLAQKIHSDGNVENGFHSVLMVPVSQTFKFEELIKNMLRKLKVDKDLVNMDIDLLLEELHDQLKGNRCLVILDDVWGLDEGSWWESLKSVLPRGNGSCVIVTTRHEEVARSMGAAEKYIHRPQLLSDEESWSLFTKIALGEKEGRFLNPELKRIGREIVGECKRLPLAIKVVGGMMKGKECSISEWSRIYENLKDELAKKGDRIFSVLEVSYQELPSQLKPCMLCLAMFPEDYEISSKEIIPWWIGEGFVRGGGGDDRRTAYEIAQEYIDELIRHCLLMGEKMDDFREHFDTFKIHDLVRDMIRGIAKEENFICFYDSKGRPSCTRSRRVSMVRNADMNLFNEINFKLLRTVVGTNIEDGEEFRQNMGVKLCQLKWLRFLNISFQYSYRHHSCCTVDWLSGIGSLKHLICLRIDKCGLERLPDSIGNLRDLQIFSLNFWPNLRTLPRNIASLEKLTTLSVYDCKSLESLPKGLGNLSNLQELWGFKVENSSSDGSFCVSDLKKMTQLRVLELEIRSEDGIEERDLKVLSELKQLRKLRLLFRYFVYGRYLIKRKMQHEFSPLQQLSELRLEGYRGEVTPTWLNPTTLPNLLYLSLDSCGVTRLSPEFFGGNKDVWKLEVVVMKGITNLVENWKRLYTGMPFLRHHRIERCDYLDWSRRR